MELVRRAGQKNNGQISLFHKYHFQITSKMHYLHNVLVLCIEIIIQFDLQILVTFKNYSKEKTFAIISGMESCVILLATNKIQKQCFLKHKYIIFNLKSIILVLFLIFYFIICSFSKVLPSQGKYCLWKENPNSFMNQNYYF